MWKTKQIKELQELLTEAQDTRGGGDRRGRTYKEIAEVLSKDPTFSITAEGVRHRVRKMRREGNADIAIQKRGWPAGKKRNQVRGKKDLPWAFLYPELLALTGCSASRLHAEIQALGFAGLPAKRTFLGQIARFTSLKAEPSPRTYGRVKLTELCTIRLHQLALTRVPGKNYWVVLAGYEVHTGFLNVAVFDLTVEDNQPRQQGRPKKMLIDSPVAAIYQMSGGDVVHLQPEIWWQFCSETVDRLGLPVTRFEYVSDFGLSPAERPHQDATCHLACVCTSGAQVLSQPISDEVFTQFSTHLTSVVHQHNERRKALIDKLRVKVVSRLREARKLGKPGLTGGNPPFEAAERHALLDYYRGLDEVKQLQIRRLVCRPENAWASVQRQGNDSVSGDVVSLGGET